MTELQHHGIKGQKWGVRRYQNSDGSYTPAGQKRRKSFRDMSPEEKASYTNDYNRTRSKIIGGKNVFESSSKLANSIQNVNNKRNRHVENERLDLSNYTDQELRERIGRENLERQYNSLFNAPEVSKGARRLDTILSYAGDIAAIGGSVAGVALAVHELRKPR